LLNITVIQTDSSDEPDTDFLPDPDKIYGPASDEVPDQQELSGEQRLHDDDDDDESSDADGSSSASDNDSDSDSSPSSDQHLPRCVVACVGVNSVCVTTLRRSVLHPCLQPSSLQEFAAL